MANTHEGGMKRKQRMIEELGEEGMREYYKKIGSIGGRKSTTGGFASYKVGRDGLTGHERAIVAGRIGGTRSKRGSNDQVGE